jgi:hypothetical protein
MIRSIVQKSYLPMQAVFYIIQRKKHAKKMMSYFLKIKSKQVCATSRICEACCYGK